MLDRPLFEKRDRRERVRLEIPARTIGRHGRIAVRGEIQRAVDAPRGSRLRAHGFDVGQIAADDANVRQFLLGDEGLETRRAMRDGDDLPVARRPKQDVAADESRRARDDQSHQLAACSVDRLFARAGHAAARTAVTPAAHKRIRNGSSGARCR